MHQHKVRPGLARRQWLAALGTLSVSAMLHSPAVFAEGRVPAARDLRAEAAQATKEKVPLIILFSLPGCPHCEVVRRSHLLPLLASKPAPARAVQIDLRSAAPLIDFAGRQTTHGEYSQQQKIVLAPVVLFVDSTGRVLADPLVGSMIPDFYGAYFDEALATAQRKLAQPALPKVPRP
jgi:hypothetical protein